MCYFSNTPKLNANEIAISLNRVFVLSLFLLSLLKTRSETKMAIKIAVLSQKGGVGKSTLARCIAVEYANHDWSVKIADMDLKQRTVTAWNAVRMDNEFEPAVEVQGFASVKDVLKQEANYDLIVFDGAGQADIQTLKIAQASDFIILPTGVSTDDLVPQVKLAHEFIKKGIERKRIGFSLSRVGGSERELTDAKEYIGVAGYKFLGRIDERTSITQAHDMGKAANETKYPTVNKVVDEVLQGIIDSIEALDDKVQVA